MGRKENVAALAGDRSLSDNRDAMPDAYRVIVRVLGPARVTVGDQDAPAELLWRKHLALLVYLARSPRRSRTRNHLVGLLWSDRDEKQARHSLSEALRVFRRALGDAGIEADVDQVRLASDAVIFDCDQFATLYERGEWTQAAALVEGEFLEGLAIPGANEFESWLAAERERWRVQGVEALIQCVEADLRRGSPEAAASAGLRAVALDGASEPAARAAMRALALGGDRAAALRVAEHLAKTLRDTLGAPISGETARLAERIREARVGRRIVSAPAAARPRAPLVGRGADLAALAAAWDRARAGRGQVVIIEGEPGEGKSRLFEALASRARLDDATVATSRVVPADREALWSAVAGLLAGGLGEAPGLAGAAPGVLAALAALDEGVKARFGVAESPLPVPEALAGAVRAAAEECPVLLGLDDAHWIDQATLGALEGLARDVAAGRVLLLLAVGRGGPEAGRFDGLRARIGREVDGAVIRLRRLGPGELRELVQWALPGYEPEEAERVVRRLERDTAGIPLLAGAMLEAVAAGFRLTADAPAWPSPERTLVDSLPGDLPPAAVGVVCLRFRALPRDAQEVLAAAAALGTRVAADQLERATALARAAVEQALDLLEWTSWVVSDARGYVFAAPIERAILLQEMITPGRARRYRERA